MFDFKIYILHCKKLLSRKTFQINQMQKFGFYNYEFYENYDANELTEDIIKKHYDPSAQKQFERFKLWAPEIHYPKFLNIAEISLAIKFYNVCEKIANGSDDVVLVFEDDVIFDENFNKIFERNYNQTPKDFNAVFFGSGCKGSLKPKNIQKDIFVYEKSHPATRCLDSFIITKKTCQDIIKTYLPFSCAADWEMAYQFYLHNHKIYWWEPSLVKQGSEYGIFQSALR